MVQAAADRLAVSFSKSILKTYKSASKSINLSRLQRAIKSKDIIVADQIVLTALLKSEKVLGDVVYARIKQGVEAGARAALGVVEKRGKWLAGERVEDPINPAGPSGGLSSSASFQNYPLESPGAGLVRQSLQEQKATTDLDSCQHSSPLLDLRLETRPSVDPSRTGHPLRSVDGRGLLSSSVVDLPLLNPQACEGESLPNSTSGGALAPKHRQGTADREYPSQQTSQTGLLSSLSTSLASFSFTFDAINPRALSWASLRSSALITEISEDTRRAARDLVRHGIEEGVAPRKLAQQVRESIGLRTDQVEAVDNLIKEIRASEPGQVITRFPAREGVRSQPGFKVKVPSKVTEKWLSQQRARYSRMQLNHRARIIARSESLHSANQGQKELWLQARDANQLPKDQKRILIVTPDERLRKAHSSAAGQIVGIDEPFDMGDGTTEPGQAVACRCGQSLV